MKTKELPTSIETDKPLKPPTKRQYARAQAQVAIDNAPPITPCKRCKWPQLSGYCCTFCGYGGE